MTTDELDAVLTCIGAITVTPQKGDILLYAGEKPEFVGIVLIGQIHIIQEDYDGNQVLLDAVTPGGIFAETLCCAGITESPVTAIADMDSAVLLLRFARLLETCSHSCSFHRRLIANMLGLIAQKNLGLQEKMALVTLKPLRARVMRYLESLKLQQGQGQTIIIPFGREEMANYLCVERSVLCHELTRLKKDGLIEYRKNVFRLT
jgi:CRP-like cAMP-binding protein